MTIWGQSAGAGSVGAHLLAYDGRNDNLFRGAICDSGGPQAFPGPSLNASNQNFDRIVSYADCNSSVDVLNCLRSVSSEVYTTAVNESAGSYGVHIDGNFVATYSSQQLHNGAFAKVPLLIGGNHDEGTNFIGNPPASPYSNESTWQAFVSNMVVNASATAEATAMLSALYPDIPAIGSPHTFHGVPNATYGAQYKRVAQLSGDSMIHRGRRIASQSWTKYNVPVYSYFFDAWPIGGQPDISGTTHFTEIQLVFDNEAGVGYLAPWWPRGSEFAGSGDSLLPLAHLMSTFAPHQVVVVRYL